MRIRFDHDLLDRFDPRIHWPGSKIELESADLLLASLCQRLDPAIGKVSNITLYLVTGRRPLDKISETDTLYNTADDELSSDH